MIYLGILWTAQGTFYQLNFLVVGCYSLFSLFWLWTVRRYPGNYFYRRLMVIFSDLGINTFFFFSLGSLGAFFYPVYLWIIVGNGVRFGPKYLLWAESVGLLYFSSVLVTPGYWHQNKTIGWAFFLGLFILPIFYLSLVKRLHRANRSLEVELQRSRAAALAKTEFLANMSHELRTPMNGILGFARLLMKTDLKKSQTQQVGYIHQSAQDLLRIIEEILDFSKISATQLKLDCSAIDLEKTLQEVVSVMRPAAEEKGLVFECRTQDSLTTKVWGDPIRIKQILYNLLGNAIKFTENGRVDLVFGHRELSPGRVRSTWTISDTGIGIPKEKLQLIFDQFEQADTRMGRRFGGTGLGLAISKILANKMEGDIQVRSELGKGSTFTLNITLDAASAKKQVEPAKEPPLSRNYRIRGLVVEDNRINQMVAQGILKQIGVESDLTDNGEEALNLIATNQYDLIFMDMQMPVMDGLEATRLIRQMDKPKNQIPIIALTANTSQLDRQTCLESGMDGHVGKPLTVSKLVKQIDALGSKGRIATKPAKSVVPS